MEIESLFKSFLEEIEGQLTPTSFSLWFKSITPISFDGEKMTIKVPMKIYKNTLSGQYKNVIDQAFINVCGRSFEFEYITDDEVQSLHTITKEETRVVDEDWDSHLNPQYTFENFVVGDSNKLAVISAKNIAQNPGKLQNPFFLYGRSGIGKTHLMHAIGNYIENNSNKKVLYTTSNEFVADYIGISSNQKGAVSINYAMKFKEKYQGVDVLIIDDIQFLVGADKSQQEFFHTFNALYQANKQIIISSDRSPNDLQKIEERLKSRFNWGLPVDIYPPEYNTRIKIIKMKIRNTIMEHIIDEEVVEYIAQNCEVDVRFIEGAINTLMAHTAMFVPEKIDLKFAQESLKNYLNINIYNESSISKIQKAVADHFNITVNDLKSKRKTNDIAKPRHIAIYLSRILTEEGLARIGLEFGGRDHSTISASIDKITNDLKTNEELGKIVKEIKNKL